MSATLYLVGVGTGDPELLTLKAVRILGAAKVIAFPQKAGKSSLSYRIAKDHLNPKAELFAADIPMSTDRAPAQAAYDVLALRISEYLTAEKSVAYLCEGDPLYYGSAMYLIDRLVQEFEIKIIPGITSLTASAAAIRRPIAARNDVLKVLPALLDDARLIAELEGAEAVAIIKIGRHFGRIRTLLEQSGHAENAMLIEHASSDQQIVMPLRDCASDARPYFSTVLCYAGGEAWAK